LTPARIGLVAPLPPQVGGVVRVAEWLLAHAPEIGCTYVPFDLWRPAGGAAGGRLTPGAVVSQLRLLVRFLAWLPRSPRVVHMCVSCTPTGLARDVVYVALLAACRRRTIAHVHGADLEVALGERGRGLGLRAIGRLSAVVVAVSPRPAADLEAAGIRATHVFNPIGIEAGERASGEVSGAGPVKLLFVGAYGRRKGIYELVAALGIVRQDGHDVRARIVGPPEFPDEVDRLAEAIRELGLEGAVALTGPLAADDVAGELLAADVFCLPSHREGLPMAILEAMAVGLPVVVTSVGGIPDLVRDGDSGLVVPPGDVQSLADAVRTLAADPGLRRRLGARAFAVVDELAGAPAVSARWRELYASLAAAPAQ
jgi:glycosyltransferase involved in cell wall biosynthesis